MRLQRALGFALVAAVVFLPGCDSDQASSDPPAPSAPPFQVDWTRVGSSGHIYLQVNTDGAKHYEIVRVDLAAGEDEQITAIPGPFGVSQFSVSPAGLALAQAPDATDRVTRMLRDGSLETLEPARGSAPQISRDGAILADRPTRSGWAVELWHGDAGWQRLAMTRGWTSSVWLSERRVGIFRVSEGRTTLRTVTTSGRAGPERDLLPEAFIPGSYSHAYGQPLVMQSVRRPRRTLLVRPGHDPTHVATGWSGGCASPDGTRLLLIGPRGLGVQSLASPEARVEVLGEPEARVLACGWVEERFGPD